MSFHSDNAHQQSLPLESDDDFEVITSEEVDAVLDQLDKLVAVTESENIRAYLEEAADNIYALIYDGSDEADAEQSEAA